MDLWRRAHLAAWLAPVVGAVVVVTVYRATHESEEGLYAGAEPVAAGVLVAAPFLVLALAQAGCALATSVADSTRWRITWASAAALLAGLSAVGAHVLLRSAG